MRIRSSLTRDRDLGDSQTMTPMIDIVFLLLVFFVCVASDQVAEMSLPTELAAGSVESQSQEEQDSWVTEIQLRVYVADPQARAVIEMNGRTFSDYAEFQSTLTSLAEISRESPVILEISEEVLLRDVVAVYDACRAAEFASINFAMKKAAEKQGS